MNIRRKNTQITFILFNFTSKGHCWVCCHCITVFGKNIFKRHIIIYQTYFPFMLGLCVYVVLYSCNACSGTDVILHLNVYLFVCSAIWKPVRSSSDINAITNTLDSTGPDGVVAQSSFNGLIGSGFASRYRLQPRGFFLKS